MTRPTDAQLAEKLEYLANYLAELGTIKSPHAPSPHELHLAASRLSSREEISEAEVQRAARVFCNMQNPVVGPGDVWLLVDEPSRVWHRKVARAALEAAKAGKE